MKRHKRQFDERARRILNSAIALFITLQIGLSCAIELWLPLLRDPEYAVRAQVLEQRLQKELTKPYTVIMLGSSRTTRGFNAGLIEPAMRTSLHSPALAFNMGCTGAGPLIELLHLRRLLNDGVHPDLLLIEVLPPLFAKSISGHEFEHLPLQRTWLNELPTLQRYSGNNAVAMHEAWWIDWLLPWYSHRYTILSRLSPDFVPYRQRIDWAYAVDNSGWSGAPSKRLPENLETQAVEKARQEYWPCLQGFEIGDLASSALQETLQICRQNDIQAALVFMPEGSQFRAIYSAAVWQEMAGFINGIASKYQLQVVNAREWIADDDFSDSHHLLRHGATVFTERLAHEAILPLLEERVTVKQRNNGLDAFHRLAGGPR